MIGRFEPMECGPPALREDAVRFEEKCFVFNETAPEV